MPRKKKVDVYRHLEEEQQPVWVWRLYITGTNGRESPYATRNTEEEIDAVNESIKDLGYTTKKKRVRRVQTDTLYLRS